MISNLRHAHDNITSVLKINVRHLMGALLSTKNIFYDKMD